MVTLGIPIPGSRIPGSRTIFSIPNPGIGDALIPGFRDYEKPGLPWIWISMDKSMDISMDISMCGYET